jgi:hypothetical protein
MSSHCVILFIIVHFVFVVSVVSIMCVSCLLLILTCFIFSCLLTDIGSVCVCAKFLLIFKTIYERRELPNGTLQIP